MKRVCLLLLLPVTLGAACGTGDNKKGGNDGWSKAERRAFMSNCIASAEKTYEEGGQQPDLAVITCMCEFSGSKIEEKYSYKDADKIAPGEIKIIMEGAAKKCLVK